MQLFRTPERTFVLMIGAISFLVLLATVLLVGLRNGNSEALLFGNLNDAEISGFSRILGDSGINYRISGDSIFVNMSDRDLARRFLASDPGFTSSKKGFEILDDLSDFSTTSQKLNISYWRAVQGELERTITSFNEVSEVRVFLSLSRPHQSGKSSPASASVSLRTYSEALGSSTVKAIQNLIAASVAGLTRDRVIVVNSSTGVTLSSEGGAKDTRLNQEAELRAKIERITDAVVGYGNSIVEVNVFSEEDDIKIIEESILPESRVEVSSDTEMRKARSISEDQQAVQSASNLPDQETSGDASGNSIEEVHERSIKNYEVTRSVREVMRPSGQLKQVSVGILINENYKDEAKIDPVLIENLRSLVKAVVAFNPDRGDVLSIEVAPFANLNIEDSPIYRNFENRSFLTGLSPVEIGFVLIVFTALLSLAFLKRRMNEVGLDGGDHNRSPDKDTVAVEHAFSKDSPQVQDHQHSGENLVDFVESDDPLILLRSNGLVAANRFNTVNVLEDWLSHEVKA